MAYSEITGMAWAYHHRSARQAEKAALARCQATYPSEDPDRHHVWLALVLDTRHGVLYRH